MKDITEKIIEEFRELWRYDSNQYPIENFIKKVINDVREETLRDINPSYPDLIPVLDKTHKWYKLHEAMGAEIIFNNLTDDDGTVRLRPVKAIYDSPLFKFQEVIKLKGAR